MAMIHHKSGFAILYAVLLVSIVLTISLSLFNITYKQIILSSVAQQSQVAFYASELGRNCARYYNRLNSSPFGFYSYDNTNDTWSYTPPTGGNITCEDGSNGTVPIVMTAPTAQHTYDESTFTLPYSANGVNGCVNVVVQKNTDPNDRKTRIVSRGYNRYDSTNHLCPAPSNRTVERAVQTEYSG